jgi:Spy/CpxP family protein refolding chaperone
MRRTLHSLRRRLFALALTAAVAACGSDGDGPSSDAPAAAETAQAPDRATMEALEGLHLTTAQREAIETIRADLTEQLEPARVAREAFVAEVLGQVENGSLDADRLEGKRAALVSELERSKPELIDAANALHAVLTPSQRQALIDAIEERSSGEPSERGAMAKELDLSWDQKRRLFSAARARGSLDRSKRARLEEQLDEAKRAFVSDRFDAANLQLSRDPVAEEWTLAITDAVLVFTPLLEPQQRTVLAARLRQQL